MIKQDILKIANDQIELEIRDQTDRIIKEFNRKKSNLYARRIQNSSPAWNEITSFCSEAVNERAQLVWQTIHRIITTSGISFSESLTDQLKQIVVNHLPEKLEDIKGLLEKYLPNSGSLDLTVRLNQIETVRKNALEKVYNEIELFVFSLKYKKEGAEAASNIININSPVGAIQTGSNSITHIYQNINPEDKEQLLKALRSVEEALGRIDSLPPHSKNEIIDLVKDGKDELGNKNSNTMKLRKIFTAIGFSIQTVANLQPAYEALKQALLLIGTQMP